jgi:hypothetical protein
MCDQAFTIQITAARQNETNTRLAQRSPLGKNAKSFLRRTGAHYPQGEPAAAQTLKIIE